jgi:hypothetical protein
MEARRKGRGGKGKGIRSVLEFLRTGLLGKDLKELRWLGCSGIGENVWGH